MYTPSIPFKDLKNMDCGHDEIMSMSDDQVRYALWAFCVTTLGYEPIAPSVNLNIRDHIGQAHDRHMNEAVAILASLALCRIDPASVERAEALLKGTDQCGK